jgi:hypothetical protein
MKIVNMIMFGAIIKAAARPSFRELGRRLRSTVGVSVAVEDSDIGVAGAPR